MKRPAHLPTCRCWQRKVWDGVPMADIPSPCRRFVRRHPFFEPSELPDICGRVEKEYGTLVCEHRESCHVTRSSR